MSEQFVFRLTEAQVLTIIEEYVNRAMFKEMLHLTDLIPTEHDNSFEFTGMPIIKEPKTRKPRASKVGLKGLVLGKPGNGSMGQSEAET